MQRRRPWVWAGFRTCACCWAWFSTPAPPRWWLPCRVCFLRCSAKAGRCRCTSALSSPATQKWWAAGSLKLSLMLSISLLLLSSRTAALRCTRRCVCMTTLPRSLLYAFPAGRRKDQTCKRWTKSLLCIFKCKIKFLNPLVIIEIAIVISFIILNIMVVTNEVV